MIGRWERTENERSQYAFCTFVKLSTLNLSNEKMYYLSEVTGWAEITHKSHLL